MGTAVIQMISEGIGWITGVQRLDPRLPVSMYSGGPLAGVNLDCSAELLDLMSRGKSIDTLR